MSCLHDHHACIIPLTLQFHVVPESEASRGMRAERDRSADEDSLQNFEPLQDRNSQSPLQGKAVDVTQHVSEQQTGRKQHLVHSLCTRRE